jgi:SAM-dependent methyltransferase
MRAGASEKGPDMIEHGQFNTDAGALARRIQAHEQYGSNDLNEWIFGPLGLRQGLSILDLGCGTGKQTLPMARAVGHAGSVLAVDISQEALRALAEAAGTGLEYRLHLLRCGLDDLEQHFDVQSFDRVLNSYSLLLREAPVKAGWPDQVRVETRGRLLLLRAGTGE